MGDDNLDFFAWLKKPGLILFRNKDLIKFPVYLDINIEALWATSTILLSTVYTLLFWAATRDMSNILKIHRNIPRNMVPEVKGHVGTQIPFISKSTIFTLCQSKES